MQKLLLVSIVVATIAIPIRAARERSAHKAFKKTVVYFFLFNAFYVLALRFIYLRLI